MIGSAQQQNHRHAAKLAWLACLLFVLANGRLHTQAQAVAPMPESPAVTEPAKESDQEPTKEQADEPSAEQRLVAQAAELAGQQQTEAALAKVDEAIAGYDKRFFDEKRRIYSARGLPETLLYMAQTASAKSDAIAVEFQYGFAWYLRGYLLVEQGRTDEALSALRKAVELSPMNAQYHSELGNLYQERKDWPAALAAYESARGASEFSPDDSKRSDEGRALRGLGFVLIEMGRLDDAERALKQALKLDPADHSAANELEYVRQARRAKP